MSEVQNRRRDNLRALVAQWGGKAELAKRLGNKPSAVYISHMLSTPPLRPISEKTARKIEQKLGLRANSMDEGPEVGTDLDTPVDIDSELLKEVLQVVAKEITDVRIRPEKVAMVLDMAYKAAKRNNNKVDAYQVRQLLVLAKE